MSWLMQFEVYFVRVLNILFQLLRDLKDQDMLERKNFHKYET